jgi:hypothetical protein
VRTLDQGVDPIATVGGIGMLREIGKMVLRFIVDVSSRLLEQRLIEVTIAHFASKVTDSWIRLPCGDDDAIQELTKRSIRPRL